MKILLLISVFQPLVFITPIVVIFLTFLTTRDKIDFYHATLAATLALGFNGVFTDVIKLIVGTYRLEEGLTICIDFGYERRKTKDIILSGRPRPDFYWRCFPDGRGNTEFQCTGNPSTVKDGRKSFPSGHSSCEITQFFESFNQILSLSFCVDINMIFIAVAFASFGFVALYSAGKLHTFSLAGKGQSWKLCIFLFTMGTALAIALSRTCDYHHHWQGRKAVK